MIGPGFAAGVFARDVCFVAGAAFVAGVALAGAIAVLLWAFVL
jgi:hypothetical protein